MKYSKEYKQYILSRYVSGAEMMKTILKEEGIPKSTFTQWLREYEGQVPDSPYSFTPKNFRHLVKRTQHLEDVIKVLNTSFVSPNASLQDRLMEAGLLATKYNVHLVCEALDISRGTYYNYIKRNKKELAWFNLRREELKPKIEEIFNNSNQTYGVRKVTETLNSYGVCVSQRLVRELMRELGLMSVRPYSKYVYNKEMSRSKNFVCQLFDADKPNLIWVSDITYFRVKDNPYFICVILDLFSRKAVACCISKSNTSHLVKRTIKQAVASRSPGPDLVFHSDRGSNYKSETTRKYLLSLGITQSFSRPHTPCDNAVSESFFATLKQEELYRCRYRSERDFISSVNRFVDFYNEERLHEQLGYIPPNQYEAEYSIKHSTL